jgi:hypothetical protein
MNTAAKRLIDPQPGGIPADFDTQGIGYWRDGGEWYLYLPGGGIGRLSQHVVTEHEDGTITASPSILMTSPGNPRRHRHGFLQRGVWEPCSDDVPVGESTQP